MANPKDITSHSNRMPPESGILYRNRVISGNDPEAYIGVIRVTRPGYYWAMLCRRTVREKVIVELRLSPKS